MYSKSIQHMSESSMNYSDANLSESDIDSPIGQGSIPPTPMKHHARNSSIDYSKFKTKLCRNYALGLRCPFEDRCAFSHGPASRTAHSVLPPPPSYAEAVVETAAPPTYANFLATESPDVSPPASPPQYPSKYRYDPYSSHGVVFEA